MERMIAVLFTTETVLPGLTRIWDAAHTAIYLLEGEREALLMDTGVGAGDLRALVSTLTEKPVTVVLSHGHVDHAMGAAGFDRVYMDPADGAVYREHRAQAVRMGYLRGAAMQGADPAVVAALTESDLAPTAEPDSFLPLAHGHRFDLGGVTVEVLGCPGHTPGSVTLLIPERRVLFLGDACNDFTFLFDPRCPTVEEYRENLLKLKSETDGRYDRVLFSHGRGDGHPDMIGGVIDVCERILRGEADDLPFAMDPTMGNGPASIAMAMDFEHFCRADGKWGNVVYCPARVR